MTDWGQADKRGEYAAEREDHADALFEDLVKIKSIQARITTMPTISLHTAMMRQKVGRELGAATTGLIEIIRLLREGIDDDKN